MTAPHGIAEIAKFYGDVRIDKRPNGWQIIDPIGWESARMILIGDLPGLPGRRLYVNKQIVVPLRNALEAWQHICPGYVIKSIGCFNPRPKRTSNAIGVVGWQKGLSLHTVGAALDINSATNPMRKPLVSDMPAEFVKCFTDAGFTHGAGFPTPDPMHMQFASGY